MASERIFGVKVKEEWFFGLVILASLVTFISGVIYIGTWYNQRNS